MIKTILLICLIPIFLWSVPLQEKYPSYRYVFSEFDIDESYIENQDFEIFVRKYEKSLEHFYRNALKRGDTLLSMVRGELLSYGLSDLFLYLSIVESGLNSDITSPKKAVGLWQFMPATAKHYNLEVCNSIDQRCDPFASTKAAIKHLWHLHHIFGKWYLAVMAYNCGEGRMQNAIEKAGTDMLSVLTDEHQRYLPAQTRDYIRKILLIAMIGENDMIDFASNTMQHGVVQVEVPAGTDLNQVAKSIGMELRKLKSLNRQFPKGKIPKGKKNYVITIPEAYLAAFYLKFDAEISKDTIEEKPHLLSHTVILGDTLDTIAAHYHSSVAAIKHVNRMEDDMLEVGRILVIPISKESFERLLDAQ